MAGGSSPWTLLSSLSLLATGLLFLPGKLDVTLIVIFRTKLDALNMKLLFVTVVVTSEVRSSYINLRVATSLLLIRI